MVPVVPEPLLTQSCLRPTSAQCKQKISRFNTFKERQQNSKRNNFSLCSYDQFSHKLKMVVKSDLTRIENISSGTDKLSVTAKDMMEFVTSAQGSLVLSYFLCLQCYIKDMLPFLSADAKLQVQYLHYSIREYTRSYEAVKKKTKRRLKTR